MGDVRQFSPDSVCGLVCQLRQTGLNWEKQSRRPYGRNPWSYNILPYLRRTQLSTGKHPKNDKDLGDEVRQELGENCSGPVASHRVPVRTLGSKGQEFRQCARRGTQDLQRKGPPRTSRKIEAPLPTR